MTSNIAPKIKTHWRLTVGEPSPALVRLLRLLLANRKENPPDTHETGKDGEVGTKNDQNLSHQ